MKAVGLTSGGFFYNFSQKNLVVYVTIYICNIVKRYFALKARKNLLIIKKLKK